ncbi:MAG: DUF6485 family protein [Candidatus Omnitrophota bacterium]
MGCPNIETNIQMCNCSYVPCSRKGRCCECLHYHRMRKELPACYFSSKTESTYDRSIENLIKDTQQ